MASQDFDFPRTTKITDCGDRENSDETDTIDMEASEDGFGMNDGELGRLTKHPKERRRHTNRVAAYILVGFFAVMFLALVPLSSRKQKEEDESVLRADGSKTFEEGATEMQSTSSPTSQSKRVYCGGKLTYALDEWIEEDVRNSADLCDPDFQPSDGGEVDMGKPVKVFIMLGEANMVGAGQTSGDVLGTLEYTVKKEKRFTHLVDDLDKEWQQRSDVRYVAVKDDVDIHRNEWLTVNEEHRFFGPELQLGYILGELYEEPVLIIKACSGRHSLGGDLLSPGSPRQEFGDWVYAGYGDSPRRWPVGVEPDESATSSWYAGHAYDATQKNIKTILNRIGDYYPGATEYEISGIAMWHGDSDRRDTVYALKYERNLSNYITSMLRDLDVPEAKVVIATVGQRGHEMKGNTLQVFDSQMAIAQLPDFRDNVMAVDIRSSWRTPYLPGFEGDDSKRDAAHYGSNAETVMEVGNALAKAMAKLLHGTN